MIASPTDPATARCWAASRGLACAFPTLCLSCPRGLPLVQEEGAGRGQFRGRAGGCGEGTPGNLAKSPGRAAPPPPPAHAHGTRAPAVGATAHVHPCTHTCARRRSSRAPSTCPSPTRSPTHTHARTQGDTGARTGVPPSRAAAGARPLYSLQEAENFLSATTTSASTTQVASRAAMTMAAMAPGPSEPAEDGGPRQPRARPPHPFLPPPPPPPGPPRPRGRTAALVQTLPRRAVLGAGRGGGRRRSGGRGLPRRAGALRRVFSRRQFGRLVPQGGLGLLRAFGCKAKDRCGAQEAGTAPPLLADRAGALCAGLRAVLALRFRGGGERGGQRRPRGWVWPQSPYRGQADPRTASPLRLRGQIDGVLRDPQALS